MKQFILAITLCVSVFSFGQNAKVFWRNTSLKTATAIVENKKGISNPQLFELDVNLLKQALAVAPKRFNSGQPSNVVISFPNTEGKLEQFSIQETSNMDPALAAKFPEIRSYIGKGIDVTSATVYFSVSPLGLQSMALYADRSAVFIEPYTTDLSAYVVYKKSDKITPFNTFECTLANSMKAAVQSSGMAARPNADDAFMRTYRLALSVTGEYTVYFGGTKALALAAMNASMTRVNAVFEMDFGVHMNMIANEDAIIYTNASTDPYAAAANMSQWNAQLQSTLTSVIGEANYDIGHLFGATGGGGNAGCIGCVCVNGSKGSGITSPADGIPQGDNFDIDYVAHEMGHQFGANHTWTHGGNEGTGVQMEPGSGSTIMGYAGITSLDVQPHSDAYFHAISIQQVTNYIKTTTCQTNTATGNAIPTANAGLDYTIPKGTPFMLTGAATDANTSDVLTYDWEEMDAQTNTAAPSATKTTGVDFRSYNPSTSPVRYFPKMTSVLAGATTTAGTEITVEALSSVARTLNFRLTVRDNHIGGPANNSDDTVITVNATAGPFSVTSPSTAVSYPAGSVQTITWNVAGTTANSVNCANVDILISTDGGTTWATLLAATPNDGTQAVTIPNVIGTTNRIMVKGTNHIFFDVSNTNFTITADTTAPSAPTGLMASGTAQRITNLSWTAATDNIAVTGYDVYKNGILLGSTTTATTFAVTGLTYATTYAFTVKAKDAAGNVSGVSNTANVTTLTPPTTTATACGSYTWTVNNQTYAASGNYTGINASGDTEFLSLTITACSSVVNLKLFIQGYYDTTIHAMRPVKANEGIGNSTTLVDNITVELRNPGTGALAASATAALQTNGTATATFSTAPNGSFYIVIKHRNAVQTWSASPQLIGTVPLNYDFTVVANKTYGNNVKLLETGVYGLYSGDIDQNGTIEISDGDVLLNDSYNTVYGYYATDLDGNGTVEIADTIYFYNNSYNTVYAITPFN